MKISVIDYGINNIFSIAGAIKKLGYDPEIITNPKDLKSAKKIILPGVGAFSAGINALNDSGFSEKIISLVESGIPILGICLGLQMLFTRSFEYGNHSGLALIEGEVKSLEHCLGYNNQKIPNIGWRNLEINCSSSLYQNIDKTDYLYFIHSFFVDPTNSEIITAKCFYQNMKINASIKKDNIFGVQFHPEKSGEIGLNILNNFLKN